LRKIINISIIIKKAETDAFYNYPEISFASVISFMDKRKTIELAQYPKEY
jgi:hypothetical protein